jgi:hypothetical protein
LVCSFVLAWGEIATEGCSLQLSWGTRIVELFYSFASDGFAKLHIYLIIKPEGFK